MTANIANEWVDPSLPQCEAPTWLALDKGHPDGWSNERRADVDRRTDVKETNPKDAAASGRLPLHLVPDTLLIFAAMGFAEGDSKYIAYNFRVAGIRASVYIAALRRHLMRYVNGEWADKKTGIPHLASVAACTSILIDGHVVGNIVDDRPPAIDLNNEIEEAEKIIAHVYRMNKAKRAECPVTDYTAIGTGTQLPVARPQDEVVS